MKVRLVVELNLIPDKADAFITMFREEFIRRSRQENGCEFYELWQNPEVPYSMRIIEVWTNQKALDDHMAQSWFQEWAPKMEEMQATPFEVHIMHSVEGV